LNPDTEEKGTAMMSRQVAVILLAVFMMSAQAATQTKSREVLTIDHFVAHKSTVPANVGQTVALYVRERVLAEVARKAAKGSARVVLFVHGGFSPSSVAYDLD
jgi:hypothetical protein